MPRAVTDAGDLAGTSTWTGRLRAWFPVAMSWAMIGSAAEFAVMAVRHYGFARPLYQGVDVFWAKPLVNALLFGAWLVVLAAWPRLNARSIMAGLAFPAVGAALLTAEMDTKIPLIILALGIAVQLGRLLDSPVARRRVIGAGRSLAFLFLLVALGSQARLAWRGRSSPGASPPDGTPNVLLIILDTVRAASLSLYGGRAATPNLEALAAQGVVFDRAIAPAPWTLPTHASLFTGLWPHEHKADWRSPLDRRAPVLAEALGAQGYRTAGFVANLVYTSRERGLDRGFQVYRDYQRSPLALLRTATIGQEAQTAAFLRNLLGYHEIAGRKNAPDINREFLAWQARSDDRPWFAFLNYYDAHEPYLPPAPWAGKYSAGLAPRPFHLMRYFGVEGRIPDLAELAPGEVASEQAAYEEAIAALDAGIGDLMAELRRRGQLERTVIVIASDHGELFGEHQSFSHGNSIYWRSIHVPLLISWPGHLPAGTRVARPVSLRDVGRTLLDLALPGRAIAFPGRSLDPASASPADTSLVLSEVSAADFTSDAAGMSDGSLQALVGDGWQYIRAANGRERLHAITRDWADTAVSAPSMLGAVLDSARRRLDAAKVPAPPPR